MLEGFEDELLAMEQGEGVGVRPARVGVGIVRGSSQSSQVPSNRKRPVEECRVTEDSSAVKAEDEEVVVENNDCMVDVSDR